MARTGEKKDQKFQAVLEELHGQCAASMKSSMDAKYKAVNVVSFGLVDDFENWTKFLDGRPEAVLVESAAKEFLLSSLANSQGEYRNAFKGLRLVLELVLQGTFLSANLVKLADWLNRRGDTIWAVLVHPDTSPLAAPFCRAFFEELLDEVGGMNTLSATLYRELSECTHGNIPKHIPLPDKLAFDESAFLLWHEKVTSLRLIVNFVLAMRYLKAASDDQKKQIEHTVTEQLGHLEPIRVLLGGPASQ